MKTIKVMRFLLPIILLFPAGALAAGLGELRLSLIEGDVQIKTTDSPEWTPAAINFPLKDGDQVWVPPEGRAEIQARRGTILRLDEKSALDILTVDDDVFQFYLSQGLAYVHAKAEKDAIFQIDSPLSSIRVQEDAKFSVDVSNDGDTDIPVYLGVIKVENKQGESEITAGNILSLNKKSTTISQLGMIDEWERWNGGLDKKIKQQKESTRYLPEELAGYASDFDANGEWVDQPQYGHIWKPTVQVTADWAPYSQGRWVWIGNDYVWIAREPWGWAPYHYGRWSFIGKHGWCWVPPARHEAYWGPGYVGWVRTSTYVAWVPLAPREVFYGHGYYGPHSVNIKQIDVNKVIIKKSYRNSSVKNSVTTVHHKTFIRGEQVDFKVKGNPFLHERISVGRPQIEPERATKRADFRKIPKFMEPPERVKATRIEELQDNHRIDRKRNTSLFVPETAPHPERRPDRWQRPQTRTDDRHSPRNQAESQPVPQTPPPPAAKGEVRPSPAAPEALPLERTAPPPDRKRDRQQRPQTRTNDSNASRNEAESQPVPQTSPPPAAKEEVKPNPTAPEAPPSEGAAPPDRKRDRQQRTQTRTNDSDTSRNEAGRQPVPQTSPPPAPREEVQQAPAEPQSPPPEPTAPPPDKRRDRQQRPQTQTNESNAIRSEAESQPVPQTPPPPAPREEVQQTPAEPQSPKPEPTAPPPDKRRDRQQRPQTRPDESNSTRPEAESQPVQQTPPPQAPIEEVRQPPAEPAAPPPERVAPPPVERKKEPQPETQPEVNDSNLIQKEGTPMTSAAASEGAKDEEVSRKRSHRNNR